MPRVRSAEDYSFLLGMYLGDGCLDVRSPKAQRLLIALDAKYPTVIEHTRRAAQRLFPNRNVTVRKRLNCECVMVGVCDPSLSALFPQHGSGRKHERAIWLESWQRRITTSHPEGFIRGLLWSDGCRLLDTQTRKSGTYQYPSYGFHNKSLDIALLYEEALTSVGIVASGIKYHEGNDSWALTVYTRSEVEKLDQFVGPKTGESTEAFWEEFHSQAEKRRAIPRQCAECSREITRGAHKLCSGCYIQPTKIQWPTDDVLVEMLRGNTYVAVGRALGVSDTAVRKRVRARALQIESR